VVDAEAGEIPSTDDFEIATASDLPLDPDEFFRMALIYEVTEFCTALKPWALEMLLNSGAEVASYLDPDIEIFAGLGAMTETAVSQSIALTPHTLEPFPRDGMQPSETDIRLAGAFNLGYISVTRDAEPMLRWWQERLRRDSVIAPQQALFVDQRWIDLVPSYFSYGVIRDPGYNVAYWNLQERNLTKDNDQIFVNGHQLRFFHYSGYDPDRPWILNKYYADRPRIRMSDHPVVYELCENYRRSIISAEQELGEFVKPYGFASLGDGTQVNRLMRKAYRDLLIKAEDEGKKLPPAPFRDDDSRLIDCMRSPVLEGSSISHFLISLWETRPDLRAAFPDPMGQSMVAFAEWAEGAFNGGEPELAPYRQLWMTAPRAHPDPLSSAEGVNVSGYFTAELGVGEAGRLVLDSVRASGLPFRTTLSSQTRSRQSAEFVPSSADARYPVSIAVVNADVFPSWADTVGHDAVRDTYVIGQWAWELEEFPNYPAAFDLVDEIWANSGFCKSAVEAKTSKPVYVVPFPVKEPIVDTILEREAIGIPEEPYFLFAFDYLSVFERKNPLGLVEAFKQAFSDNEGPHLVIKSINGDKHLRAREQLWHACQGRSDIHLVERYMASRQVHALMHEAISYVSLHRSEGFGLTLAEAMSHGKPVIATAYSGNLDYMTESDSLLVPFQRVPVPPGCEPYPPSAIWAEPDLPSAARHMRWVASNPDHAGELGKRAREAILEKRSLDRAGRFVLERVRDIVESGAPRRKLEAGRRRPTTTGSPVADRAMMAISAPPDMTSQSNHPELAKRFRQLTYRALAHHDARTDSQLSAVVQALSEVDQERRRDAEQLRDSLSAQVRTESTLADLGDRLNLIAAQQQDLSGRLTHINHAVERIDYELEARPYTAREDAGLYVDRKGDRVMGYEPGTASMSSYAEFEDTYRGPEELISSMLQPYVPLLAGAGPVVDIGCGRGELLSLLRAAGIEAFGFEMDETMRARSLNKGLDVRLGDGIEFLGSQPEASLGAVVSIQVVEHLQPDDVRRMFEMAYRALRPGGIFLAETVNPHSPGALKAFWLDLTHIRPLYPEALIMLAKVSGYESARIVFPLGTQDLDHNLRTSGSYAVVASKQG
jgi:glycosyltransferase involved in cell wall biosynthesis/SAM-dependent methyltransferase